MIHYFPSNDLREHMFKGLTCECHPTTKTGDDDTMIIHNSFDGRENKKLEGIAAYGKETRRYYEGEDLAKNSIIFHTYMNYTSATRQPFDIDGVLEIRTMYSNKIKAQEETGKEELGFHPDYCNREIAGCDLLLKLLTEGKAY